MNECDYCQHVKMCGWRKSLEERGCDFFDDGNGWIPVSERMPEDGIPCICTVYNTDIYRDNIQVYDNYLVYDEYTEQWIDDDMELCPYDVIAWMPLPEPYKAESEVSE